MLVEDPRNGVPQGSIAPFLVPCDGDRRFTLPFSEDPMALTRKYDHRWAILPSGVANFPCSRVEPEALLSWLNTIFETCFTLSDGIKACLLAFIDNSCDLGQVYGYLQPWIHHTSNDVAFSMVLDQIAECRKKDFELQSAAINSNRIVDSKVPPHCVWDLYSN